MQATMLHPRLPGWESRLQGLINQAQRTPFQWGVRDCCLWAADAALALTGRDPAADVRGTYTDEAGAMEVLRRFGGLRGVAARGGQRIRPAFAMDGDVGLVRSAGKPCLAVWAAGSWMLTTRAGLWAAPAGAAVMAWGVGHA